jgi:hypothetical protein
MCSWSSAISSISTSSMSTERGLLMAPVAAVAGGDEGGGAAAEEPTNKLQVSELRQ